MLAILTSLLHHLDIFLVLYALTGPGAWLLLGVGLLLGRARMGRLRKPAPPLPGDPPLVTVLVPAKDEGERIEACVRGVLALDYPRFNVIAVNDRSTDGTGDMLDRLARENPDGLTALHIQSGALPEGWTGKCHALHVAAQHATGDWLLFVDSDVTLQTDALRRAIAVALQREYDAVSLLTRLECHTFWEKLIMPVAAACWAVMNLISLTNDDNRKEIAFANGQFFLMRRSAYERIGGHAAVRGEFAEDVEMMRRLKLEGFTTRFFTGDHLAATRMYTSPRKILNGWARIYATTSRRRSGRIVGSILFLIVSALSAYVAVAYGAFSAVSHHDVRWLSIALLHIVLMTTYVAAIYRWSGNRARYALLFPLTIGVMLAIFAYALRLCGTGKIAWRGTSYTYRPTTSESSRGASA